MGYDVPTFRRFPIPFLDNLRRLDIAYASRMTDAQAQYLAILDLDRGVRFVVVRTERKRGVLVAKPWPRESWIKAAEYLWPRQLTWRAIVDLVAKGEPYEPRDEPFRFPTSFLSDLSQLGITYRRASRWGDGCLLLCDDAGTARFAIPPGGRTGAPLVQAPRSGESWIDAAANRPPKRLTFRAIVERVRWSLRPGKTP